MPTNKQRLKVTQVVTEDLDRAGGHHRKTGEFPQWREEVGYVGSSKGGL